MELTYEFYIACDPEKIWQILVSQEGTKQTLFGSVIRSSFREGDRIEYVGPGEDGDETVHIYGQILAFEPNRTFRFTEHPGPSYHKNHAELETRITYTLEKVGTCTKLTLVHDRWPQNHPSYEDTKKTWWMVLSNVKTLAETGRTIDIG